MAISTLRSVAKGVMRATEVARAGVVAASTTAALALKAVGFTPAGPAAGSYAAIWMSATAIANGGGVPAGSLYSVIQAMAMGDDILLGAVLTVGALAGAGAVVGAGVVVLAACF